MLYVVTKRAGRFIAGDIIAKIFDTYCQGFPVNPNIEYNNITDEELKNMMPIVGNVLEDRVTVLEEKVENLTKKLYEVIKHEKNKYNI